jgi:multiple sugar transport system substrate-binding protein
MQAWRTCHTILLVATVAAGGCTRDHAAPIEIEFWAMGREGAMVGTLVSEFERRTPGVRVRVQQIPWSAAHEKILTAYVGDALPDVLQVGSTWLAELVAVGALAPLDELLASAPIDRADYIPSLLDAVTIRGQTFALPWYVDTRVLFYRTDLLRSVGVPAPPETWARWLDVMTRLADRGDGQYALLLPAREWETPVALAWQRGARLLRDDDRYGDFRSPAFREALAFYGSLFARGLVPRGSEVGNAYQDFARGSLPIMVSGAWSIGELAARLPPRLAEQWGTAPMPAWDAQTPGVSVVGGAGLAIAATSRHKQAAWQWMAYLADTTRAVRFYEATGDLPPRASAWQRAGLHADPRTRTFWGQLRHVRAAPAIPEWGRIARAIGERSEAVARAWSTVDEAVVGLDRDVDAILEKRRWLRDTGRLAGLDGDGERRIAAAGPGAHADARATAAPW